MFIELYDEAYMKESLCHKLPQWFRVSDFDVEYNEGSGSIKLFEDEEMNYLNSTKPLHRKATDSKLCVYTEH